jgi:hypothetical protein
MDLVWPVAAWAVWIAALVTAFKLSSRERPPEQPPTEEAPQPVIELLRGMRAQEVFHAALFELAGRGWARIEGDRFSLATIEGGEGERRSPATIEGDRRDPAPPRQEPLPPYERWVLERVSARMAGAPSAPVIGLMPEGTDLESDFMPLVRQRAIDLGLARRRWTTMIVPLLLAAALVVPWYATVSRAGASWSGGIATLVAFVAGVSLLMGGRGFLLTARGRELAGPEAVPLNPDQEWIFTGSGWQGVEIEPAGAGGPAGPGPKRQEIAGYVVKRWTEAEPGGAHGPRHTCYIALHDGRSDQARAFRVDQGMYKDVLPGDSVRLLVKPRSGTVVRVLVHERHW